MWPTSTAALIYVKGEKSNDAIRIYHEIHDAIRIQIRQGAPSPTPQGGRANEGALTRR